MNYDKILQTTIDAVMQAGDILLEERKNDLQARLKEDGSPVCNGDIHSAEFLNSFFKKQFPDYGLLCEETLSEDDRAQHQYSWIIDPLDGTHSYLQGKNGFGVIVGLIKDKEPVMGVVYRPLENELLYAVKGKGAYSGDGKRLVVPQVENIDLLVSGNRFNSSLQELIDKISPDQVRPMYTAFKTIEVAKGNGTVFTALPNMMNLWDICGTSIILEEAGGRVSNLKGERINFQTSSHSQPSILATNGYLHDRLLEKTKNFRI